MFVSDKIILKNTRKGKGVFATKDIAKDELILEFERNFSDHPTRTTLRVGENLHQESTDPDAFENFINHSCEPDGYIDFNNLSFRALRDIKKGEELTYNYLTTDYDFEDPFECKCGSKHCFKHLKGFKYLTLEQKKALEPYLSPFLRKKLKEEL